MEKTITMNKPNTAKLVLWVTTIMLGVSLILFERINYVTTYESLKAMFGTGEWILFLSCAVVLIDVAALANVFIPGTNRDIRAVSVLLCVWCIVSSLDIVLTWYYAVIQMEATIVATPSMVKDYMWAMPAVVAAIVWGVQLGLLYLFGSMLGRVAGATKKRVRKVPSDKPSISDQLLKKVKK